jgi:hypothetical protein
MVGDTAVRAHVQHSNIHGNGEGLSEDAQLGHQGIVHKTHIGRRVDEWLERLGLVAQQQGGMEKGVSKGRSKIVLKTQQSTQSYK